jgi:hypothetical protein
MLRVLRLKSRLSDPEQNHPRLQFGSYYYVKMVHTLAFKNSYELAWRTYKKIPVG